MLHDSECWPFSKDRKEASLSCNDAQMSAVELAWAGSGTRTPDGYTDSPSCPAEDARAASAVVWACLVRPKDRDIRKVSEFQAEEKRPRGTSKERSFSKTKVTARVAVDRKK
ncbi:unnamed protein product [Haemonchus placei]|uniref:Uncharacterized protein n=1 Tax=Haemonchus placei TaxID=6290 RepID=A0A0N4WDJ2_HAEPC|nr:unnamed protein product [Haemonchus placei]